MSHTVVHRFQASLFPVNAYLVETASHVVAVDATLGVTDGRALRAQIAAIGKPLAGVIVTHSHPDHYGAVAALLDGDDVPVFAVGGVDAVIRRDDAAKEVILRPMFGDEWPARRTFPNRIVKDGDTTEIGGARFRVVDAGPSESPHDSWWLLEEAGSTHAFVGDLVYHRMHAFLADGFYEAWLANLARAAREFPDGVHLMMGHGEPSSDRTLLEWQAGYIRLFVQTLQGEIAAGRDDDGLADRVCGRMQEYLPGDQLLFLLRLSVAPMRDRLLALPR